MTISNESRVFFSFIVSGRLLRDEMACLLKNRKLKTYKNKLNQIINYQNSTKTT